MKKIISIMLMLMCFATGFAQNEDIPQKVVDDNHKSKSITVNFMERDGAFLKKEYYELGNVKGVTCDVLIITDLKDNNKVGCLRLKTTGQLYKYTGILDADEIAAATQCLEYIKDREITAKPSVKTEVMYISRDDVKIGTQIEFPFGVENSLSNWKIFVQPNYRDDSKSYFNTKHLEKMIGFFKKAKELIEEKIRK